MSAVAEQDDDEKLTWVRCENPQERWEWADEMVGKYAVSDRGRIASFVKTARYIKIIKLQSSGGYLSFSPKTIEKPGTRRVHFLVAKAFVPGHAPSLTVNHKDGVKTNNHYTNLEWLSLGDNIRHGFKKGMYDNRFHGVPRRGEEVSNSILTEEQVRSIFAEKGERFARLVAEDYGVSPTAVFAIWSGRNWGHLNLLNGRRST